MTEGLEMHNWANDLWPINRSLTGQGVRETLLYLKTILPDLTINSIASGTKVFDWIIPDEWHCRNAYIITPDGNKICDFKTNNLHVLGYSTAINKTLSLAELKKHLYTQSDQPDVIPYVTSYYNRRWGFCLSHNDFNSLREGQYQVFIDSEIYNGQLNYADIVIKGKSSKEILLSTYICHPSMANNELSGPLVSIALARHIKSNKVLRRYLGKTVEKR